jgi:hypothetical protein
LIGGRRDPSFDHKEIEMPKPEQERGEETMKNSLRQSEIKPAGTGLWARLRSARRSRRLTFLTIAALGLTAGATYAAIPSGGGVINGCFEKRTGLLRVIDAEAGKKCLSFETSISWNQKGPKGDPGVQGTQGTNGVDGKDGVSVTSANEPAGAHCAYGGSAFTAANAVTYACNGAPGAAGGLPALHYVAADVAAYGTTQGEAVHTTQTWVRCPVNEAAIGGGFINNGFHELVLRSGFPTGSPVNGTSAWMVEVDNDTANDLMFSLYAVCVPVV